MSQDSAAVPDAARKLAARRRREIVAVLLFSGGPIFESSIPLSVFGIDRQDAGVPRYRLLVCAGEDAPLRTTGGSNCPPPTGWRRSPVPGRSSYRPGVPSPRPRRPPRSTRCAGRMKRAPESSGCARGRSSSPRPDCSTAARPPPTGCTRRRSPSVTRPSMWTPASSSSTTAMCSPPRERRPVSTCVCTSCAPTTARTPRTRWPAGSSCRRAAPRPIWGTSATWTGHYLKRSAPTRWPRSSPGRWSISTSSSTWRRWPHAPI